MKIYDSNEDNGEIITKNDEISFKRLANNILWGFTAQGMSLVVSMMMSFVVAKLLSVTQYGYWQLYIFYLSYVCFFHCGIPDGIYLRFGGEKYDNLNKILIGSELKVMIIFHFFISTFIIIMAVLFLGDKYRLIVVILTAIYLIFMNVFNFLGMILQAVNKTQEYSKGVIIDRLLFLICIIFLCIYRKSTFIPFSILYLISRIVSTSYVIYRTKDIFFSKLKMDKQLFDDIKINIKVGINLTFSVILGMLILGIGRSMIDFKFGIETFGKLSLTISLTNFFINFLSQISMVLFPALKSITTNELKKLYSILNTGISNLLLLALLAYYPIVVILTKWLPEYVSSAVYLSVLMPLCVFEGKNQIIGNTYLKVIRGEKYLFKINVVSMIVSTVLSLIGVFVISNINFVLISMLIAIFIKYTLSILVVQKNFNIKEIKPLLTELFLACLFIIGNKIFSFYISLLIYLFALSFSFVVNRKGIFNVIFFIRKGRKKVEDIS